MKVWIITAYKCSEDYTESAVVGVFSDRSDAESERERITVSIDTFQKMAAERRHWRIPEPPQILKMLRDGKTHQEIEEACSEPPNPIPTEFSDFTDVEVEGHEVR